MITANLLAKKRDGHPWSDDEIRFLIDGFCRGDVEDYQMAAMAMAVCARGMDAGEVSTLAAAMLDSGDRLPRVTDRPRVDKHSTGGLGDKVSLVLAPLLAACGVDVPMISGRGLGRTGGTLDKLEAIPGFRTDLDADESSKVLRDVGAFIVGASQRIAPADRRLYAIRDVTGTVESVPLITASILSKKLAASLDALVMDVKVGGGAFMNTVPHARELADSLRRVGHQAGLPVATRITDMDQPLGRAVGNAIEVNEVIDLLDGQGPAEVRALCVELAAVLLAEVAIDPTIDKARDRAERAIDSGAARARFHEMVAAQGGRLDGPLPLAPVSVIETRVSGYVAAVDCESIADAVISLGGGRRAVGDPIDPAVGVSIRVRIGDRVEAGQPVLVVHGRDPASALSVESLSHAIRVVSDPVQPRPLIIARDPFPPREQSPARDRRATVPSRAGAAAAINDEIERLIRAATDARGRAYAPHSNFAVGAALITDDGTIVTACNIENASYSMTLCAERVAAATAVARGYRNWRAMAVVSNGGVTPCGACRQFLAEFAPDVEIVCVNAADQTARTWRLSQLLPEAFGPSDLIN